MEIQGLKRFHEDMLNRCFARVCQFVRLERLQLSPWVLNLDAPLVSLQVVALAYHIQNYLQYIVLCSSVESVGLKERKKSWQQAR